MTHSPSRAAAPAKQSQPGLTRRRLITISAALALLPMAVPGPARAGVARLWTGTALGARASIRLDHPQGATIAARVLAEIDRLEDILSLYRTESALSRLNRAGTLAAPPFELLEILSLAGTVHAASTGGFDPTVQPLWTLWAEAATAGRRPSEPELAQALSRTGWAGVRLDEGRIVLRPGMALTLNGFGQGYVADKVAALLLAEGLTGILIDTGEFRALGGRPEGGGWRVTLTSGSAVALEARALATSAPLGTTFDPEGRDGHILDPRSGRPTAAPWREVSISAPAAALADALSTAACLTPDRAALDALLARFPAARCEAAIAA